MAPACSPSLVSWPPAHAIIDVCAQRPMTPTATSPFGKRPAMKIIACTTQPQRVGPRTSLPQKPPPDTLPETPPHPQMHIVRLHG